MKSINASEFQFAMIFFAKFNELHNYNFNYVFAPNQRQEGTEASKGSGTDLVLDEYFLQFKMSEYYEFKRKIKNISFNNPQFKFKVYNKPNKTGNGQLDLLIRHTINPDNKVFYVVPCFNSIMYNITENSNNFWINRFYNEDAGKIGDFACFFDIREIVQKCKIENNNVHKIIYEWENDKAYYFSSPDEIKRIKLTHEEINIDELVRKNESHLKTKQEVIDERILDVKNILGDDFFEKNGFIPETLGITDLHYIYLMFFNIFWLPITINSNDQIKKLRRLKLDKINNAL